MTPAPAVGSAVTTGDPVVAFALELPHGACVGVSIATLAANPTTATLFCQIPEAERAFAETLSEARRASFLAGRYALRSALFRIGMTGLSRFPLLPDGRGAPRVPPGSLGSISHKKEIAVGLACRAPAPAARAAVGVDLEELRPLRANIAPRVLTAGEQRRLASVPEDARDAFVLTHFSLKEAFYKAANGFVGREVPFHALDIDAIAPSGFASWASPLFGKHGLCCSGFVTRPRPGLILTSALIQT